MGTIIKTFLSGTLGGIWGYVAVAIFAAGLAGSAGVWTTHKIEVGYYEALQLKDAKAATIVAEEQAKAEEAVAATQHALDSQITTQAVAEAQSQIRVVTQFKTITEEIPFYVPETDACISYGFVRLLDAAVLTANGTPTDPSGLALPSGQFDYSCAPIKDTDLVAAIVDNYKAAGQNAEQLNALEASIKNIIDTANR